MGRGQLRAHAVLDFRGCAASVVWVLNGRPLYVRDFDDWESALRWSDQLRDQYWATGWRLSPDDDDAPSVGHGS